MGSPQCLTVRVLVCVLSLQVFKKVSPVAIWCENLIFPTLVNSTCFSTVLSNVEFCYHPCLYVSKKEAWKYITPLCMLRGEEIQVTSYCLLLLGYCWFKWIWLTKQHWTRVWAIDLQLIEYALQHDTNDLSVNADWGDIVIVIVYIFTPNKHTHIGTH